MVLNLVIKNNVTTKNALKITNNTTNNPIRSTLQDNKKNSFKKTFKNFSSSSKVKEQFWGYFFVIPGLFFFVLFVVYPLLESIWLSFNSYDLRDYTFVGLKNYISLFKDDVFLKSIVNTFLFVLYIVPATVVFSLLLAVLIIEKSPGAQTFFRAAFYLPVVISIVSVSLVWNNLYSPAYGILNYILSLFGAPPVSWLGNSSLVIPSLSLVILTYTMGQPIILNLAALGGIPVTYYEASDIDGASSWHKFWKITVPLLKPTTLYIFVTTTISAFQVFAIINLMTSGGPNYASSTVLFLIYRMAFYYNDFGMASTMGVILFLCVALFSVLQFKLFSESVEY